ncbi:Low affinity sulfate transporter 3 [Acorus calamus]|uniref:Low affinity sulfate transporter 3 n=1 Tax=Acorus calamus TaxID=4465 RepID=A0AAV9DMX3_ACOCL|nr:Low affinity sulfate transporter 3 [Acorus calamus]
MSSPKHFKENMAPSENESEQVEEIGVKEKNHSETVQWVLNPPEPPTLWCEFTGSIREAALPSKSRPIWSHVMVFLNGLFPILQWGRNYNLRMFKSDLMAGLTLASLSIPQSIGYAGLARLDPQYGLYTSVVPPLIYAVMGSSREIAIGPVAVISLLLSSMIQKSADPSVDPTSYRKMVFTATFFAGVFQAAFGIFRLGFLVDFLSHAAIVGFMGGAAIVIGLQQLKGLLGITHFTNKTDVVSVVRAVWVAVHQPWHPYNFLIGCLFLIFILIARFLGRRNKKLFWLPAIAPLLSVVLSTLMVFLTRVDNHGVKTVQYIKGGLNPSSASQLEFNGSHVGEAAKIGLIAAIVALTEAVAVGRSFASAKGYHIDGNKEMTAMGFMNITGSLTSCYVATGSFSRSAVNFSAGCKTAVSNIVMAITVFVALQFLTRLLYYTPITILASIILSALPGLIDIGEAYEIWKVDKQDFLACIGAFFGVLFCSVEIGLLAAVTISFANIILNLLRPRMQMLGRIQGTDIFCSVSQYPVAVKTPGFLITRIDSSFLSFINANFVRDRIVSWAVEDHKSEKSDEARQKVQFVIIDMSNVVNIDTSGIAALEDIHKKLVSHGLQMIFANPGWQVIQKLKLSKFFDKIGGGKIFFTVGEAVDACLESKKEFPMC